LKEEEQKEKWRSNGRRRNGGAMEEGEMEKWKIFSKEEIEKYHHRHLSLLLDYSYIIHRGT